MNSQSSPDYKYRPSLIEENPALLLWLLLLGAYLVAMAIAKYAWFLHDRQIVNSPCGSCCLPLALTC